MGGKKVTYRYSKSDRRRKAVQVSCGEMKRSLSCIITQRGGWSEDMKDPYPREKK